jgi:hypothetical protein
MDETALPRINFNLFRVSYYWHAGITGREGEILTSIIESGVKPKSALVPMAGNANTQNPSAAYAANDGAGALEYLRHATDYNWSPGGLPFLVALKINDITTDYSFDTDISVDFDTAPAQNRICWFCFIMTFKTLNEFLEYDVISSSGKTLQQAIVADKDIHWKRGNQLSEDKNLQKQLWELLQRGAYMFLEGQRLKRMMAHVEPDRWARFIKALNNIKGSGYVRNLLKVGGWDPSFIKRIYILSPGGDKDWKRWARVMQPTKEAITQWVRWHEILSLEGKPFPADGALVRIK